MACPGGSASRGVLAWVMLEFLKEVDLSSLVDRVGGLDVVVGWNW